MFKLNSNTLRPISLKISQVRYCKQITRFPVINKIERYEQKRIPVPLLDVEYNKPMSKDPMGIRHPGYWFKKEFYPIKEMEPLLMVPDLTGFNLKPYVSYKVDPASSTPLTAKELFNNTYAVQIIEEVMEGKEIDTKEDEDEPLFAKLKALQTGADMFDPSKQDLEQLQAELEQLEMEELEEKETHVLQEEELENVEVKNN